MTATKAEIMDRQRVLTKNLLIEKAKNSLLAFTAYTKRDYTINWHHKVVAELLDKFERGEVKKLMIFIPPQHGKSELSSRRFPAYALGKNPDRKIALCSYGAELAQSFNRDTQRIIDTEKYRDVFPETQLNSKNVATDSKGSYKRTGNIFEVVGHNGYMKTVGVGGPLTGTAVDIGIVDDPFKDRKEANSETVRKSVWEWYTDVFESRLHNDSQQLVVLTRWHEDDLAGRILKRDGKVEDGGEWEVVVFPALKEDHSNPYDPREIGEALWEEKHSRARMEKIEDKMPRTFASLYQQRPAPADGNIIMEQYFTIMPYDRLPEAVRSGVKDFVIDTAYTEKQDNDPSAILAYIVHNNFLYLYDYVSVRKKFGALKRFIKKFVKMVGQPESRVYVEPKASGESIVQELLDETDINAIRYKMPGGDKIARTNTNEPYMESLRIIVVEGSWNKKFIEECKVFPNGTHDEAVDLLNMSITQGLIRGNKKQYDGDADYA